MHSAKPLRRTASHPGSVTQAVAHAALGDQVAAGRAELAPQAADVDVDRARLVRVRARVAPDAVPQRLARQHVAFGLEQPPQQAEFRRGELHRPAFDRHGPAAAVDHDRPDVERRRGAALQAPDARDQVAGAKWSGEDIVGGGPDRTVLVRAGGDQDGEPVEVRFRTFAVAVAGPRQVGVEHDQVGPLGADRAQRLDAVARHADLEALRLERSDQLDQPRLVLDDEDLPTLALAHRTEGDARREQPRAACPISSGPTSDLAHRELFGRGVRVVALVQLDVAAARAIATQRAIAVVLGGVHDHARLADADDEDVVAARLAVVGGAHVPGDVAEQVAGAAATDVA